MFNEIFGNRVSRFAAWKAGLAYKLCKKIFGEQKEPLDLVAVAKGEVYKDFKVLTLVRREDLDAQKDDDGKQLKVHEIDPNNALVIGTIRMGFGHWRIAIALASVAASMNVLPFLHKHANRKIDKIFGRPLQHFFAPFAKVQVVQQPYLGRRHKPRQRHP